MIRRWIIPCALLGALVLLAVPAVGLDLHGLIRPGFGIGPAQLGMSETVLTLVLGTPDFQRDNTDGSRVDEWDIVEGSGQIPDAGLWVVLNPSRGADRVGTDIRGGYADVAGNGVGSPVSAFSAAYTKDPRILPPGLYLFTEGIGVLAPQGTVTSVWVEAPTQPSQ